MTINKIQLLLLAFFQIVLIQAQDVSKDKWQDPDLLFSATFDNFTTVADLAVGNPVSPNFSEGLTMRGEVGFDLQNAFNLLKGERLSYDAQKNISPVAGTVTMWLKAKNYSPKDVQETDQDKCHKAYLYVNLENKNEWLKLFLYQYYSNNTAIFYWQTSALGEDYKTTEATLSDIKEGQWFQIAATWDENEIKLYINGELGGISHYKGTTSIQDVAKLSTDFEPDPKRSFIDVRRSIWEGPAFSDDEVGKITAFDDLKIYNRALSAPEIKLQYLKSLPEAMGQNILPEIDIQLNGVDDRVGELDRLEVIVDLSLISTTWKNELKEGTVKSEYVVRTPSGREIKGTWEASQLKTRKILDGIIEPGEYDFQLSLTNSAGEKLEESKKIVRPDTSWFKNSLGKEDIVPAPWTPMSIDKENTIKAWGREYRFKNSPLPVEIIHTGDSLLTSPPKLVVMIGGENAVITYAIDRHVQANTYIELYGTGQSKDFTIVWKTRVEYDGMIRCDFTINGEPTIDSMKLTWTVNRKYSDFLLDPLLKLSGNGVFEAKFPDKDTETTVLWLTSGRRGFCWAPEDDANWVYDLKKDKPIKAVVDDEGGLCEIEMITRQVTLPPSTPYHAMFIGTPSRPLPKVSRTFRFGGLDEYSVRGLPLMHHRSEGMEDAFLLKPNKRFGELMDLWANRFPEMAVYGGATALSQRTAEWKYFGKYWNIPEGYSFLMRITEFNDYKQKGTVTASSVDPGSAYSDLILANMKLLFEHPKQRHVAMYYDLCINYRSINELNGRRFQDKFGRNINSFIIMGLREHLKRTKQYCESMGKFTIYHDLSYYNPFVHSFGDYWYPGEEYFGNLIAEESPYYYFDSISDDVYRSELNQNIKGSGILFLGELGNANEAYVKDNDEPTMAMCTKLLLNDIPVTISFHDGHAIIPIWEAGAKYQLDDSTVHLYYQQKDIQSSNPQVVVTYYQCPKGRYLAIVGNLSKEEQQATLDITKLSTECSTVRDEYYGKTIDVSENQFKVTLPPRLFTIIGIDTEE